MNRVVLDTNVFVSAVLGGALGELIDGWRAGKFTLVVSDEIVREYFEVLRRPNFGLSTEDVEAIVKYVFRMGEFVTVNEKIDIIQVDPKDNIFLEAAIAGNADCIISGDGHLLEQKEFRGIPILTARQYLEQINR